MTSTLVRRSSAATPLPKNTVAATANGQVFIGSSPSRSSCARVESETPSLDFDEPQQVRNPLPRCIAAEAHVAKIGNQPGWMLAPIGLFGA